MEQTSMQAAARIAMLCVVTGALSAPAAAQTQWDMPTPYPAGNFQTRTSASFAADVERATGGSLKITVHAAGSQFRHPDIKPAVRRGAAAIGEALISLHASESPIYGVDSVPFLATG